MAIKFQCPHCQAVLTTREFMAGRTADCPVCAKEFTVPDRDPEVVAREKTPSKGTAS